MSGGSQKWMSMIGLEIHAQISSKSKLFSGAMSQFMAPPNDLVSCFDAALPGAMPVLNKYCVEAGVKTALALSCEVQRKSLFDRKHYFYADLPLGYQITQQRKPIAVNGHLSFHVYDSSSNKPPMKQRVNIKQIQLEQDSGKSLHDDVNQETLVDLNRAGVGLMELVTDPDLKTGEEAAAFVRELQLILQKLGTCDGKMDEGSLRVDANISVNQPGQPPGHRAEVKNITGLRSLKNAIDFEIKRQIDLLEKGGEVAQETRSYNMEHNCTVPMRDKEVVQDYRFMPEPNLPPLVVYDNETIHQATNPSQAVNIDTLRETLPVLPEAQRIRLVEAYGITYLNAVILINEDGLADFFERSLNLRKYKNIKQTINWTLTEFLPHLKRYEVSAADSPFTRSDLAELLDLLEESAISPKSATRIMETIFEMDLRTITEIINDENLGLISDKDEVRAICRKIIEQNPQVVAKYRSGKKKALNTLMGSMQKVTGGRVDPALASNIFKELISEENAER